MVSYTNAQLFKKKNNTIKINIIRNTKNPSELMPLSVAYHDPSTTSHIRRSVLR